MAVKILKTLTVISQLYGSSTKESDAMEKSDIESGLAALKQGNYSAAIAYLEKVCEQELHKPTVYKAQIGLVKAYERIGNPNQAKQLCQTLTQSQNSEVKQWAVRNLAKLMKHYPQPQMSAPGGSTPTTSPTHDPTGFVPFESLPQKTRGEKEIQTRSPHLSAQKWKGRSERVNLDYSPPTGSENDDAGASWDGASSDDVLHSSSTLDQQPEIPQSITPLATRSFTDVQADPTGFIPLNQQQRDKKSRGHQTHPEQSLPQNFSTTSQAVEHTNRKLTKHPITQASKVVEKKLPASPADSIADLHKLDQVDDQEVSVPDHPSPTAPMTSKGVMGTEAELEVKVPLSQREWRQAGRAQNWRPIKGTKQGRLLLTQVISAIALFWFVQTFMELTLLQINRLLSDLPLVNPIQAFYYNQTWTVLLGLFLLLAASPWLMDLLLRHCYGLQPLSFKILSNHSPEAAKMLLNFCRKRHLPQFTLGVLPTEAPIAFTYGCLPRFARIVVSEGFLSQLKADEIATIYAGEIGHIIHSDFALMSLGVLLCQLPYIIYWQVARSGDQWQNVQTGLGRIMLLSATIISALAYGLYWVLRWPMLWLSRLRMYYSDRTAAVFTGNPNALSRALLKMSIGIAEDVKKTGQTSWLLEGFDLLTPVGYQQAMSLGSYAGQATWETLLIWDCINPYRQWMAINNTHPPIGDRLQIISLYAKFWNLDQELDFTHQKTQPISTPNKNRWTRLFNQGAPFFGLPIGIAIGAALWLIGFAAKFLDIQSLAWLWQDQSILAGCLSIGVSIGILLRINHFFPDITPANMQDQPELPELFANPTALPLDSQPIRLQGKLLGRTGISNLLGQDLILESDTGLVKLHCFSKIGPLGYLWPLHYHPRNMVGQTLQTTGWFRRGATPWIDIETLQTTSRRLNCGHPIWSTILLAASAIWGGWLISGGRL